MKVTEELKHHLIQSQQAYEDWYFNGGKEKAEMRCKILLLEEILKRYKKNDALNYGKIICSNGSILDFDLSPSLKLYVELIKEISKDL